MAIILVSACLLGYETRYKGDGCANSRLRALAAHHTLIPVCPEQLGGLATPRDPAERQLSRVMTRSGADVTAAFQKGAAIALDIALLARADFAILKSRSPSCGSGTIYDGTFSGTLVSGNGTAAELLLAHGIPVYSEEDAWPGE